MTEVFTWPVGRAVESEYGGRRKGTPLRFVLVHVAFSAAGGALTGFALAAAGSWVRGRGAGPAWVLLVMAGCLVLVAIAFELQAASARYPNAVLRCRADGSPGGIKASLPAPSDS